VTFYTNQTFSYPGGRGGSWECAGSNVTLEWRDGFIDRLILSRDGNWLSGTNQYRTQVSGSRQRPGQ
jgi:hypothetical protein